MEATILEPDQFFKKAKEITLADVRTPLEYEHGHVPGACLFPLFSNEERAEVGTLYAKYGSEKAIEKGYEIAGPKIAFYLKEGIKIAPARELYMYCWRGGMRSSSLAWLLGFSGFKVSILKGGYKAYRAFCRKSLDKPASIILLGGYTGTGKSEILEYLEERGEQVLKLEKLANHKGSAFGWIGEKQQPSQEQFENLISECWLKFDLNKTIWIEDESINIGKLQIPRELFKKMETAAVIIMEAEKVTRISRLVRDYEAASIVELIEVFCRINKRIGMLNSKVAIEALERKELSKAAEIALQYYDKVYSEKLVCRHKDSLYHINYQEGIPENIDSLLNLKNKIGKKINGSD